jgi:glyoxylase I family protein
MVEVIGIDHIYLTVSDLDASEHFNDNVKVKLLGFKKNKFSIADEPHIQYFNQQFGFVLRPSKITTKHDPYAPGLHHLCLRVDSTADVNTVAKQLRSIGVNASEARLYPEYAPGYMATFFEDPDGIRLEVTNSVLHDLSF